MRIVHTYLHSVDFPEYGWFDLLDFLKDRGWEGWEADGLIQFETTVPVDLDRLDRLVYDFMPHIGDNYGVWTQHKYTFIGVEDGADLTDKVGAELFHTYAENPSIVRDRVVFLFDQDMTQHIEAFA